MIYERMKERTGTAGIYSDDAERLSVEIRVYAEELERSRETLDRLLRERFVTTAQDEGLGAYERLFDAVTEGKTVEQRRESLLLRMSLREDDFTPAGIRRALDSLGVSYDLNEYPVQRRVNITVTSDHTLKEQAFIRSQVSGMIPAHLICQLSFNTLTWQELDNMNRTFSSIDSEDMTWDQIDNRQNES